MDDFDIPLSREGGLGDRYLNAHGSRRVPPHQLTAERK